jgi:hypothetical protein
LAGTITNTVGLTFEYQDGMTRNYTFTGMADSTLSGLKNRVLAMNGTIADETTGAPYKETFVSDDGQPLKRISKAKYTIAEEQVIYRG